MVGVKDGCVDDDTEEETVAGLLEPFLLWLVGSSFCMMDGSVGLVGTVGTVGPCCCCCSRSKVVDVIMVVSVLSFRCCPM